MRRIILILLIFCSARMILSAQAENFAIRSGAGYYMDAFTADDGPVMWLEGGFRLKTGFFLNSRISMSTMDWKIREGIFKDYKTIQHRQMLDLTFSKPFPLKGSHYLEPGIGFKLKREYLLRPDIMIIDNPESSIIYTTYSKVFYELGFTICLDYYYLFKSNFFLGLRADSNVIWALGFEGLTFSPLFGFRF